MGDIFERFETEVKRGVTQVAVTCLLENEKYGYEVAKNLRKVGLNVEEGTLYPLLKRLEDDEVLSSHWETEGSRPRKYYIITDYGKKVRNKWLISLNSINVALKTLEVNIPLNGDE